MKRKIFCEKLKQARINNGLKQDDIAKLLEIPVSAVSALENGSRKIDILEMQTLSEFYNKSINWFLDIDEKKKSNSRFATNELLSEAHKLLEQAPPKLQRAASLAVIGFLKESDLINYEIHE